MQAPIACDRGLRSLSAVERVAGFGLVLAWSWILRGYAAPAAAPPQPAQAITRQGQTPKRALAAPSYDSNAPIKPESRSILSKIVAHFPLTLNS